MSAIAKMTANKISFEIAMGNDVEKYRKVVENFFKCKQISAQEREDLLALIDSAKEVVEE